MGKHTDKRNEQAKCEYGGEEKLFVLKIKSHFLRGKGVCVFSKLLHLSGCIADKITRRLTHILHLGVRGNVAVYILFILRGGVVPFPATGVPHLAQKCSFSLSAFPQFPQNFIFFSLSQLLIYYLHYTTLFYICQHPNKTILSFSSIFFKKNAAHECTATFLSCHKILFERKEPIGLNKIGTLIDEPTPALIG